MKNLWSIFWGLLLAGFSCKNSNEKSVNVNDKNVPLVSKKVDKGYTSTPFTVKEEMVLIKKGKYTALYGRSKKQLTVNAFMMDVYPVTNEQYLAFVKKFPQWRKSEVKKLFADGNYLATWLNDTSIGLKQQLHAPVTNVSWFAANAYCESIGKRLPTVDEWEYVAMADETHADARIKKNV